MTTHALTKLTRALLALLIAVAATTAVAQDQPRRQGQSAGIGILRTTGCATGCVTVRARRSVSGALARAIETDRESRCRDEHKETLHSLPFVCARTPEPALIRGS